MFTFKQKKKKTVIKAYSNKFKQESYYQMNSL